MLMAIPFPTSSYRPRPSRRVARRGMASRVLAVAVAVAVAASLLAWGPAMAAPSGAATAGPDCSRALTLGLHEHGLLYSGETGEGIDKDIADEMARRSGCRITLKVLPRARIWQLIESGALDFSLSAIDSRERDKFASFAWYDSNKYYLLVRRDAHVDDVRDVLHRKQLKVGAIRSFRYGDNANALIDALDRDERVTYATTLEPLFSVLLDNRIQAMIIEPFDYTVVNDAALQSQTSVLDFDDPAVPHGLVMSKKALSPEQQQAWRQVIADMRADGTMRRIFEKYFPADLAKQMTQF